MRSALPTIILGLVFLATLSLVLTSVEIEIFAIWPFVALIPLAGIGSIIGSLLPRFIASKKLLLWVVSLASLGLLCISLFGKPFVSHYFYNHRDYKGVFVKNHHFGRPISE